MSAKHEKANKQYRVSFLGVTFGRFDSKPSHMSDTQICPDRRHKTNCLHRPEITFLVKKTDNVIVYVLGINQSIDNTSIFNHSITEAQYCDTVKLKEGGGVFVYNYTTTATRSLVFGKARKQIMLCFYFLVLPNK